MNIGLGLGIKKKIKDALFREKVIEREVCGRNLKVKLADRFGEGWYGCQHDTWPELEWITTHGIKAGDTVIDCGANHGFTSVLFSMVTGDSGKVFAVEPLPRNQKVIVDNIALNGITNCEPVAIAASDTKGEVEMLNDSNGSVVKAVRGQGKTIMVPQDTLDNRFGDQKIDFLKMDVEGFELEALNGARNILATRPRLAIELHVMYYKDAEKTVTALLDLLNLSRYEIYLQPVVDGPITKEDDLGILKKKILNSEVAHLFCR